MHNTVVIGEIENRAKALNLNLKQLAKKAGLAPSTAYRAAEGNDCRKSTADRLTAKLIEEELRLLCHLVAIHGPPQPNGGAP